MISYFVATDITIGPFTLHVWGVMVALGILIGTWAATVLARKRGLNPKIIWDVIPWVMVGAFVGARMFHVLLYEPTYFFSHPAEILAVWNGGLSISGGLVGAVLVGVWFLRRRGVSLLDYIDVMAFGLPLGSFVGRIGCFLTHLHPGTPTNFFLGVLYPDGIVRHDLGLYLSLDGLVLFHIFLLMFRKRLPTGSFIVGYLLWYGTTRFFLDFLRATDGAIVDARYFGLTPAQYLSVLLVALGMGMLGYRRMKYLIPIGILLIIGIGAGAWWLSQPRIDVTDKIHAELYENASDTWDPQMEVVPFERQPSTMMTVRWQPPEETYNHFVVTISKADGTLVRKESGEHDRMSLDLDQLEPETEYVFALQACLDRRCEGWLVAQEESRGTTQATEAAEAIE